MTRSRLNLPLIVALVFGVAAYAVAAPTYRAERWRVVEITLTAAKPHPNPFADVNVDATFIGPHTKLVRPAFWDGGATWKIRFAAPETGKWSFVTTCSDPTDRGLQAVCGTIDVAPYRGKLAIFKHGFVKVGPTHRYFTYADGTPFFYLGDTHWEAMHERWSTCNLPGCSSQFKYEVSKRVAQGFTVYQSEWMAGGGAGPDQEPYYDWNDGITASDMPGFRNADRKFAYLADSGLVIANALNWRGLIPTYSDAYLRQLGRYWAARYGAYPVLWTMGQETDGHYRNDPPDLDSKWQTIAQALAANDCYHHPLSAHTCNAITASTSEWRTKPFHTWYAVQMQQIMSPYFAEDYWRTRPTEPAVHYEPPYENFWTDAAGERTRAYIAFLSGFCGFGYGVAGVWDDTYSIKPVRDSGTPYDPHPKLWYDGLERPSADQMTYMKRFFTGLDWWKLTPRFDVRSCGRLIKPDKVRIASEGWRTIVALFFNKARATGSLSIFNPHTRYIARWYDPRKGHFLPPVSIQPSSTGSALLPRKPDDQDWVILLKAANPSAKPPPTPKPKPPVLEGSWNHLTVGSTIPSAPGLDGGRAITIAIWAKLDALPKQNVALVNKEFAYRIGVGSDGGWHFEVATVGHPWYKPGTSIGGWGRLEVGKWYHIVGTYDGAYLRLYLDGKPAGASPEITSGAVVHNDNPLELGRPNTTNIEPLKGELSRLRIYSTALTPAQVQALYNREKP